MSILFFIIAANEGGEVFADVFYIDIE